MERTFFWWYPWNVDHCLNMAESFHLLKLSCCPYYLNVLGQKFKSLKAKWMKVSIWFVAFLCLSKRTQVLILNEYPIRFEVKNVSDAGNTLYLNPWPFCILHSGKGRSMPLSQFVLKVNNLLMRWIKGHTLC